MLLFDTVLGNYEKKMDQKKAGCFFKQLRKEKGLTQEKIAEQINVSGRTISRRETGTNMPDFDILIEMADFYEVVIRELIDVERKSEMMNKEMKETVLKVADYSNEEKTDIPSVGDTSVLHQSLSAIITSS